jgi:hypothetical protein
MSVPKSYKGILELFKKQPVEICKYFRYLPPLIKNDLPYDIALAYLFSQIERAHRRTLYCGITKRYSANSELTDEIIRKEYVTRDGFKQLFKNVYGQEFPDGLNKMIEHAEDMRDTEMHGKPAGDADLRQAIHDVFEYAKEFNRMISRLEGFEPFGDLRGFKGRGENMDKETTRWILKGLSFSIK